jgi:hypothetical protein
MPRYHPSHLATRRRPHRLLVFAGVLVMTLGVALPVYSATAASRAAAVNTKTFSLFPATSLLPCMQAPGKTAKATATVTRGTANDTLVLTLSGFKPGLAFDMFTVQRSNQKANGSPVANFANFGLAWYQSDVTANSSGGGTTTIKTILLDQIFGFDPAVSLAPTNTFHVGFWFNNPADAASCGFTGSTPFNGEHHAGPLAFITRPNATTGLGPLCTKPNGNGGCNP